jgi:hypothetical protein
MEQLIFDSVSLLKEDNIQVVYDWMDIGEFIMRKAEI